MPNYYNHEDYVSVKDMRGWHKDDKAEQMEINWWIRIEYYADKGNHAQFGKMVKKWYEDHSFPNTYPATDTMKIGKMAKRMPKKTYWEDYEHSALIKTIIAEGERIEARLEALRARN